MIDPGDGSPLLDNRDRDLPGINGRIMWDVLVIPQKHLDRMLAWRQFQPRLRLPPTEVQVVSVVGNLIVQGGQLCVDQQMVMPGIGFLDPSGRNPHASETHPHPQLSAADDRAILWPNDVGFRSCRRR